MRPAAVTGPLVLAVSVALLVANPVGAAAGTENAQVDGPRDTIRIVLQPDGDARVTVTVRVALSSTEERRAFDRLVTEFEQGQVQNPSPDPFRRAADLAEESTGRTMAIQNVTRIGSRTNETGRLSLSFTWTGFADARGSRLEVGDVFHTRSGTWLPELTEQQELVIEFPPGYSVVSSSRGHQNGSVYIRGPEEFDPGEPWVTLDRQGGGTSTDTLTPTGPLSGTSVAVGVGVILLVLLASVLLIRRRSSPLDTGDPSVSNGGLAASPPAADDPEPETTTGASTDPEAEELLSDEERVLRLLYDNGGRMKQADIVTETDWSNAKVSQLLSEMADHGLIEKLRIGRENLISLPDEAPDEME